MSAQDVSDVVAWLASQRPKFPGQPYPNYRKIDGRSSMTLPDGLTRRDLFMKIGIFFNGIVAADSSRADRALSPFSGCAREEGRLRRRGFLSATSNNFLPARLASPPIEILS